MKTSTRLLLFILAIVFLYGLSFGTTWYVRPPGGSYGNEDGTAYADAGRRGQAIEILNELIEGNGRFIEDNEGELEKHVQGQSPKAAILTCADSRIFVVERRRLSIVFRYGSGSRMARQGEAVGSIYMRCSDSWQLSFGGHDVDQYGTLGVGTAQAARIPPKRNSRVSGC